MSTIKIVETNIFSQICVRWGECSRTHGLCLTESTKKNHLQAVSKMSFEFFGSLLLNLIIDKALILKWLSKHGQHFLIIVLLPYLALFSFPSWKILPVNCGIFFNIVVWLTRVIDFTSVISNMFLWLDGYKVQVAHKVLSGVWIYITCWFISQGWFAAMINSITKKISGIFYLLISQNSP